MAEFTKQLSSVNVPDAPVLQTNTGSDAGDILSALNFGAQLFSQFKGKQQNDQLATQVSKLRDLETQALEASNGNRFKASRIVDAEIRKLGGSPAEQLALRTAIARNRGESVTDTIRRGIVGEAEAREQSIDSQFSTAMSMSPEFVQMSIKRNPDGTISTDEKLRVVEAHQDFLVEMNRDQKKQQNALVNTQVAEKTRILEFHEGTTGKINTALPMALNNISEMLTDIPNMDGENAGRFQEVKANTLNEITMLKAQLKSDYAKMRVGLTDAKAKEDLTKLEQAAIFSIESFETRLKDADLDMAKRMTSQASTLSNQLKIKGMVAMPTISMLNEIAPSASSYVVQRALTIDPDITSNFDAAVGSEITKAYQTRGEHSIAVINGATEYANGGQADSKQRSLAYSSAMDVIMKEDLAKLDSKSRDWTEKSIIRFIGEASNATTLEGMDKLAKQMNNPKLKAFFNKANSEVKELWNNVSSSLALRMVSDPQQGLLNEIESLVGSGAKVQKGEDGKLKLIRQPSFKVDQKRSLGFTFQKGTDDKTQEVIDVYNNAVDILEQNRELFPEGVIEKALGLQVSEDRNKETN